jgi:hypothetical protein
MCSGCVSDSLSCSNKVPPYISFQHAPEIVRLPSRLGHTPLPPPSVRRFHFFRKRVVEAFPTHSLDRKFAHQVGTYNPSGAISIFGSALLSALRPVQVTLTPTKAIFFCLFPAPRHLNFSPGHSCTTSGNSTPVACKGRGKKLHHHLHAFPSPHQRFVATNATTWPSFTVCGEENSGIGGFPVMLGVGLVSESPIA